MKKSLVSAVSEAGLFYFHPMAMNLDKQNERVKEWTLETITRMQAKAKSMNIKHVASSPSKGSSIQKLKDRYRMEEGVIQQTSIRFPRSLIWPHKGAGKGRAGNVGSKWTDKYGRTKTTKASSKGKMATGGRTAKPFFNEILDGPDGVEELATIVAEETGDSIINNMLIQ